jgi:hypothetical protein
MKSILLLAIALLLILSLPAQADFKFIGKIPAPEPDSGCTSVTGLSAADGKLFATVGCDTSSFLYLLSPQDGSVIHEKEYDGSPPDCPGDSVRLVSGAYEGFGHYWVGDECGNFINIIWVFDSLAVYKSFMSDTVDVPHGLSCQEDTIFTVDYSTGRLAAFDLSGNLLAAYDLPGIDSPTALALYRNHFFIPSETNDSLIFEITKEAAMIDTHYVEGLLGTYPLSATFYDGSLYVGSDEDSILIFKPTTYNTWVPKGDSVTIEAVPEKIEITFDEVVDSCWVRVEVAESQACPVPDSVVLFSDVYDITTCATFEYVAHIVFQDTTTPPGPDDEVRIFSRPAGSCATFRDITVDTIEVIPILARMSRMQSEDDEFSTFAMAIDSRDRQGIIELKFDYTRDAITTNEDSIPGAVYTEIVILLNEAESSFIGGNSPLAAVLVDSLADIVFATPAIPHTYYPGEQGHNIAGLIISSAHTLSFSLWTFDMSGVVGEVMDRDLRLALRPNPSGGDVTIEFDCRPDRPVAVSIYNVRGRLVRRFLRTGTSERRMSVTWQGDNDAGRRVSAGAYFVVVREGDRTGVGKIILQR